MKSAYANPVATLLSAILIWGATSLPVRAAESSAAQVVIDSQITAFRNGDHAQAFSYAAPGLQRMMRSQDNFIAMVKQGYGAIYGARNWSFGRSRSDGGTLYQEVLLTGPDGNGWTALYTLRQEPDGSWRIHGVQMQRTAAQTT